MSKYKIIYADPPWDFSNKNTGGSLSSGANSHYDTMSVEDICNLPINEISDDNCVLFMWWVGSQPIEALEVMQSWGFTLKTMTGFNWVKLSEDKSRSKKINSLKLKVLELFPEKISSYINEALESFKYKMFFGMGFWTRAGSENCLIATKGKPKRVQANVRSVVMAKLEEHSKKPNIFRDKIIELCGDVPRIELFARKNNLPGWDVFGNEVEDSIEL